MEFRTWQSLLLCLFLWNINTLTDADEVSIHERTSEGHKFLDDHVYDDETHELSVEEKRRLLNLRKANFEEEGEILNDESEGTQHDSELDRFVRLLEDDEELELITEDDEPVKRTRSKEEYSLNPRVKLEQLLKDIKREKTDGQRLDSETDYGNDGLEESFIASEENADASSQEASSRKKEEIPGVGELFEGDIVMDPRLYSAVTGENEKRDAVTDEDYLWPNARVPYVLSNKLSPLALERIKEAIKDYHKYTCVKFVPRQDSDKDYLYFFSNKSMCYSTVGRAGGGQKVSIGKGCERKGTVIHEMLHSIGFIHEQSRPDRDKFAKVFQDNIKKRMLHNFKKYPRHIVSALGEKYDFDSVMHYHNKAFSKNGEDTIESLEDPSRRFGQRVGFSKTDIRQVNKLYPCHKDENQMDDIAYE